MKIIYILALAMIISVMNSTMFNVALPSIRQDFDLSSSQVSWVVTSYIIIYAIGSVTYGKLADKYRLKNLLTVGICLFAVGSIVGFVASDYWMVIAGRILQSAGASVIPASSMIIPIRYVSPEKRGRALGITSSGMALGTAMGPIIAGMITSFADWRYLFAISLLSLVTIPFFRKYLNQDQVRPLKIDLWGGVMLAATVTLLLLAITNVSFILAIMTIVLLIIFILYIRQAKQPFLDPAIFRNSTYTMTMIIACLALIFNLCVPYLIPQMLSSIHQLSSFTIGMIMFPGALIAAIFGIVGGRIADSKGNTFLLRIAFILQLMTYIILAVFTDRSYWMIMGVLVIGNTGLTFAQVGLANTVSRTLDGAQVGVGMGLYMMLSFISGAIGTTVLGLILDRVQSPWSFNSLWHYSEANTFSNIFLVFAIWMAIVFIFFFRYLRVANQNSKIAK